LNEKGRQVARLLLMITDFDHLPTQTRYEIIAAFSQTQGSSVADLANRFGVCQNTVRSALCWAGFRGPVGKAARPCVLSQAHKDFIETRTLQNRKLTNKELAQEMIRVFADLPHLSPTTVGKCRAELELLYRPVRFGVELSDSARGNRVKWCQMHQELGTDWERIVFSDESWFELGVHKEWVWRHQNEYTPDVCRNKKSHPPKVMVWGAVGHNFKSSLHIVNGTVDARYYFHQILNGGFLNEAAQAYGWLPDGRPAWICQQDNARPHICKAVTNTLEQMKVRILTPWPAYSPDLNIIERVWAIMKRRVQIENPQSAIDLKETVQRVWDNLGVDFINSLVAEMERRLIQVIANEGRTIQHL
jgi:transposase-like protein